MYRFGYAVGAMDAEALRCELGVDAQREERPMHGGVSQGLRVDGRRAMVEAGGTDRQQAFLHRTMRPGATARRV